MPAIRKLFIIFTLKVQSNLQNFFEITKDFAIKLFKKS